MSEEQVREILRREQDKAYLFCKQGCTRLFGSEDDNSYITLRSWEGKIFQIPNTDNLDILERFVKNKLEKLNG